MEKSEFAPKKQELFYCVSFSIAFGILILKQTEYGSENTFAKFFLEHYIIRRNVNGFYKNK